MAFRDCWVPHRHDPAGGAPIPGAHRANALLDPAYRRDGVGLLADEPFQQPDERRVPCPARPFSRTQGLGPGYVRRMEHWTGSSGIEATAGLDYHPVHCLLRRCARGTRS